MTVTLAPDHSAIQTILGNFLATVVPPGTPIVEGQDNRVAEPQAGSWIELTPIRRKRISTNVDTYQDVAFLGFIVATDMVVTEVTAGELTVGATVLGPGVAAGTVIQSQIAGETGGAGAYQVSISQTVAPGLLTCGGHQITQSTEITYQVDVHAAMPAPAADMAQAITTAFRDSYATSFFASANPAVSPLYADNPRQVPFINDQSQYESRWIVEAVLQADQVLSGFPQSFFTSAVITVQSIQAALAE